MSSTKTYSNFTTIEHKFVLVFAFNFSKCKAENSHSYFSDLKSSKKAEEHTMNSTSVLRVNRSGHCFNAIKNISCRNVYSFSGDAGKLWVLLKEIKPVPSDWFLLRSR